jgi:Holliday junction resolvasome RuvABC endonuclease subunit
MILGIDPSGAFKEGKGTTGFALLDDDGTPINHYVIEAHAYESRWAYWSAVINSILTVVDKYGAYVSMEDYVLYGSSAKAQINSQMETSKLIGAIEQALWEHNITVFMRNASQVKGRWADKILEHKGILVKHGNGHTCAGKVINQHAKDALRHAVHCYYFELNKKEATIDERED